jgi:hypothetical protein
MAETRQRLESIRPAFQAWDSTEFKFPHPFFGDMSAAEWLALIGWHESRHLEQIRRMIA